MKLLLCFSGLLFLLAAFTFRESGERFSQQAVAFRPADTLRVDSMVFSDFFSPNGDGNNDFFIVQNVDLYPQNTFKVFNRWGQAVYEAAPYVNDWDGTNNQPGAIGDTKLPEGIYFFELKSGTGYTAYGKITLKR